MIFLKTKIEANTEMCWLFSFLYKNGYKYIRILSICVKSVDRLYLNSNTHADERD